MWVDRWVSRLPLRIVWICPGGVSAHWRGVLCCRSRTGEREAGRKEYMVCGNVVLMAERGMGIQTGGRVVYSGGLMETRTSPRVCGDGADPCSGRWVMRRTCVVREVMR
jgi:hypothetical protein